MYALGMPYTDIRDHACGVIESLEVHMTRIQSHVVPWGERERDKEKGEGGGGGGGGREREREREARGYDAGRVLRTRVCTCR
jgi:hypothetical protein